MPRTAIAVIDTTRDGATYTLVAGDTTNNHSVVNDGLVYLIVKNTAGAPGTVTIATPGTVDTLAIADKVVTVANGMTNPTHVGPFPTSIYGTDLTVTPSATTMQLAAMRLPPL